MIDLIIKFFIISIFECYVVNLSMYTKGFSDYMKFSIYNSISVLFMVIYSLYNIYTFPLRLPLENLNNIISLNEWFIVFLFLNIILMLVYKIKTPNEWFNNIVLLYVFLSIKKMYISNILLLTQSIRVFNGIYLYYIEIKQKHKEISAQKIRKWMINYIRLPIWILFFIFTLYNYNVINIILMIFPLIMIIYDRFVINKIDFSLEYT